MDFPFIILNTLGLIAIFGVAIFGTASVCFFSFKTEKIISLLTVHGFTDMSNQMQNVVSTIGKIRPYNGFSKESKTWNNAWDNFRKMKIPKDYKDLYRLQFIAKAIDFCQLIVILAFLSIPCFFIVLTIIVKIR
jgi:hypothetical protein